VLYTVGHPLVASDGRILDEEIYNMRRGQLLKLGHSREHGLVLESFLLASIKEPRVELDSNEGKEFLNGTQADASEQGVELEDVGIEKIRSIPRNELIDRSLLASLSRGSEKSREAIRWSKCSPAVLLSGEHLHR